MINLEVDIEAVRAFCERWRVSELSLFGSVLTDRFGPESDVDVMVAFAPQANVGLIAMGRMQRELEQIFGRRVDLVTRNGLKRRVKESITSHVLYAA